MLEHLGPVASTTGNLGPVPGAGDCVLRSRSKRSEEACGNRTSRLFAGTAIRVFGQSRACRRGRALSDSASGATGTPSDAASYLRARAIQATMEGPATALRLGSSGAASVGSGPPTAKGCRVGITTRSRSLNLLYAQSDSFTLRPLRAWKDQSPSIQAGSATRGRCHVSLASKASISSRKNDGSPPGKRVRATFTLRTI